MTRQIKNSLYQPAAGEQRAFGFIERMECANKLMFFYLKNESRTFKLSTVSPQTIKIRSFTPDAMQIQFGCNLKQVDVPVVFVYKPNADAKMKSDGEIVSLEFVPKNFNLDK